MTYEDPQRLARRAKARAKPRDEEHRLQAACVRLFRLKYPRWRHLLFAVPNGGRRDAVTGARLKAEGATAGVADLILFIPNRRHGGLAIEMKTPNGRQSKEQREWQRKCEEAGNKYVLCRSAADFLREIDQYFKDM